VRGDLPHVSVAKQWDCIKALSEFDLGRFLIQRGGLNGFWTHYAVMHPKQGRITGLNNRKEKFGELESFILNRSPVVLATQQRFAIFKNEIQKRVRNGCVFASIPSGLMADFLDLDYSHLSDFVLHGIDLDTESLEQAAVLAKEKMLFDRCRFSSQDAWNLHCYEKFDLVTSNGLNIYEPDDQKVIALYRQFYAALKTGGHLITSFLTPPPLPGNHSEWDMSKINAEDALLQKILFGDVLDCKWQVYRTEAQVKSQLSEAGFEIVDVIYDTARIFPTVVAQKRGRA
jgi:SAM-dependent methyltransferase